MQMTRKEQKGFGINQSWTDRSVLEAWVDKAGNMTPLGVPRPPERFVCD